MLTPSLVESAARKIAGELMDVIVELPRPPRRNSVPSNEPRTARISIREAEFEKLSAPVRELIHSLGGQVLGQAWINNTLKARVPAGALETLDSAENVRLVDLSHRLKRD